jgi:hypothetical protein
MHAVADDCDGWKVPLAHARQVPVASTYLPRGHGAEGDADTLGLVMHEICPVRPPVDIPGRYGVHNVTSDLAE